MAPPHSGDVEQGLEGVAAAPLMGLGDAALEMSLLDNVVWIPAALTAVAFFALAFNEKQHEGPLHVPWLSVREEVPSLSCTNLSLVFLFSAISSAIKAVEEYAWPRAATATEFNQMLRFLKQDTRQRVLKRLLDPWWNWGRLVWNSGPVIPVVLFLGSWTHKWKVLGLFLINGTIFIGCRSSRHLVHVACQMCRECIQQFIDEMREDKWKQAAAKHQLIDEHMESLFSGMLGKGTVVPSVVRSLVLGGMAGAFMVLVTEPLAKLMGLVVMSMEFVPFAVLLNDMASVTDLCNRTSPRLRADHVKAAAHEAAAAAHESIDREEFLVFMQYLSSTECGVMIGGVLVTKDLVMSVFVKIGTYLPLMLGILKSLQT